MEDAEGEQDELRSGREAEGEGVTGAGEEGDRAGGEKERRRQEGKVSPCKGKRERGAEKSRAGEQGNGKGGSTIPMTK